MQLLNFIQESPKVTPTNIVLKKETLKTQKMSHFLKRKYVCTKFLTFPKEKIPDQITKCEKLSLGKKGHFSIITVAIYSREVSCSSIEIFFSSFWISLPRSLTSHTTQ